MDQSVNIPFSYKLDPGDSDFTIEVLSRFRDNPNRLFGFSAVTLCPDYFSKKAYELDMDSEKELKAEVKHDFNFEVEYDRNVYDTKAWEKTSASNLGQILKSINSHFEQYKPAGCLFPAVVFDWFDILSLSKGVNEEEFHKSKAQSYYGEVYDAAKHSNWLPLDYRDRLRLNNMVFPTLPEAMNNIRIRMTISPNVTVAFSNNELPQALGIGPNQMPTKVKNQFQFTNDNVSGFIFTRFIAKPKFDSATYTTKIHAYPANNFVVTNVATLKTTVENERKPEALQRDYNNTIRTLAFSSNLNVSLEHLASEKKFKIIFPTSSGIRVSMRLPPYVSHRLGYGHVDNIKYNMVSAPYPTDTEKGVDLLSRAQVLVYDAGMVVVSLDEMGSQQTYQFTNPCMAILEAHESGVMTTKPGVDMPRVPVSQFNSSMKFVLSRFNENNEPIPLGWKDGAYIRGVLVGKL